MIKTIRVMLIPNDKQRTRLFQFAGSARFAYNWALEQETKNHAEGGNFISDYELRRRFTVYKNEPDNRWLYTISNNVCKQAVKDAVTAYQNFFKGLAEHPKYKSRKRNKPSFYADPVKIKFTGTHVKLENIAQSKKKNRQSANWFRLAEHERIPTNAKYSNPRISFDGLNWFLTVGIEINDPEPMSSANDGIGIDLGIKDLAICSTGHVYRNINKTSRVRRLTASLSTERARAQRLQDNKGALAMKRVIEKLRAKKTYKKRARMLYMMKHVLAIDRR